MGFIVKQSARINIALLAFCAAISFPVLFGWWGSWLIGGGSFVLTALYLRMNGFDTLSVIYACLALALPTSFRNFLGTDYGAFPVSWYNLLFGLLVLYGLAYFAKYGSRRYGWRDMALILLGFFLLVFLFLSLVASDYFLDGAKDFINFVVFALVSMAVLLIPTKNNLTREALIVSGLVCASMVLFQLVAYFGFHRIFGNVVHYWGAGRLCFGALFTDFSFISLYLACCAALLFTRKGLFSKVFFLLLMSVFTSARTGIVSFAIMFLMSLVFGENRRHRLQKLVAMTLVVLCAVAVYSVIRVGTDIKGDNGRLATYASGFANLAAHPLWGTGLGIENYAHSPQTSAQFPHNTYLQIFAQGGVVSGFLFCAFLAALLLAAFRNDRAVFWGFLCACLGALFIPDLMNLRFPALIAALAFSPSRNAVEGLEGQGGPA
jgi:O-antigen ligase